MPVVSTEVFETLKSLGLDEAKALRAAAAVSEARTEADRRALGEVVTMHGQLEALRAAVDADLAAMRADLAASLEAATAAQRETAQSMLQTLKAETDDLRRLGRGDRAARRRRGQRTPCGRSRRCCWRSSA